MSEINEEIIEEVAKIPWYKTEWFDLVKTVIFAIIAAYIITHFLIINANIPSGSMENTIMTGDRLVGNRLAYVFAEPKRGDIVIFRYPVNEKELFIKRIIGLPGEKVEIIDGGVYIDGASKPLDEPYLKEEWVVKNDDIVFEVPEGCYLMLGDNRNGSSDARYWAEIAEGEGLASTLEEMETYKYVSKKKIIGKAIARYIPKFKLIKGATYE